MVKNLKFIFIISYIYNFTFRGGKYYAYAYIYMRIISSKIYQNVTLYLRNNSRQSVCPTINKAL